MDEQRSAVENEMEQEGAFTSDERFREMANSMPHILWTSTPEGQVDYLNKVYTDYTGVTLDVETQSWLGALHPDDVERVVAIWSDCVLTTKPYSVEFRIIHVPTQTYRWHAVTAKAVLDLSGRVKKWYGTAIDIHERKVADEKADRLAYMLENTLESMSDAFVMVDDRWRVEYLNSTAQTILGRKGEDLIGTEIWEEFPALKSSTAYRECHAVSATKKPVEFECRSPIFKQWFEVKIYPSKVGLAVYFRDITSRKNAEESIQRLAFYDQLTGLPNRQLLRERLQHALLVNKNTGSVGAVMFIDLDNFKTLNDTLGHATGDALIKQTADRLVECVRETDTVARFGGDEFVVILERLNDVSIKAAEKAELIAETILASLVRPLQLGSHIHRGSASIGVTLLAEKDGDVDEILKRADLAMYRAKAAGRNTIRFFDPEMQDGINARLKMEVALRESIELNLFTLHYQPQVDATGKIIGAEALLRWNHPEIGSVSPSQFIPIAEDSDLILKLGTWVIEAACRQLVIWSQHDQSSKLTLSINVSPRQFLRPDFVETLMQIVHDTGAKAERLKIELTETVLVNNLDNAVDKIRLLGRHGMRVSLDDFGTGYSSLSYLKYLPLAELKIDKSFTAGLPDNTSDAAITQGIIAMGHKLGISVAAEGVEHEAQLNFLIDLGCDVFQGYFYSPPLPPTEFIRLLGPSS